MNRATFSTDLFTAALGPDAAIHACQPILALYHPPVLATTTPALFLDSNHADDHGHGLESHPAGPHLLPLLAALSSSERVNPDSPPVASFRYPTPESGSDGTLFCAIGSGWQCRILGVSQNRRWYLWTAETPMGAVVVLWRGDLGPWRMTGKAAAHGLSACMLILQETCGRSGGEWPSLSSSSSTPS
ncbi:hypothetical protein BC828DRAFT_378643 [Blastocladiella britannica]|nr:hypothetical protein BC828DRAFT_378643 [Blastocladiella britannica]